SNKVAFGGIVTADGVIVDPRTMNESTTARITCGAAVGPMGDDVNAYVFIPKPMLLNVQPSVPGRVMAPAARPVALTLHRVKIHKVHPAIRKPLPQIYMSAP